MADRAQQSAIYDHAVIGEGRTAALVSRDGSIDWLCWPRFDSPSIFAAILDVDRGGRFSITPAEHGPASRRYLPDTNVLETTFTTGAARLVVTDFMPAASEQDKARAIRPSHEVLRLVECVGAPVEIEVAYDPRPDYGVRTPTLRDEGSLGLRTVAGRGLLALHGDIPLAPSPNGGARGRSLLQPGDQRQLSLTYTEEAPAALPALGDRGREELARTVAWWRTWASRARYDGRARDLVVRSALALKLLAFAPSGAIVAAPTTSLPERPGGGLNWDYRYCWLRDAALTTRALRSLGYADEAGAFVDWLLHATRLTRPALRVLYDVYGRPPGPERELQHLAGHGGARPVRVGNAAAEQRQLDVYGEVVGAAVEILRDAERIDRDTAGLLVDLGRAVCESWRLPDSGIWEDRGAPREHTLSRAMAWVTLDRLLSLGEGLRLPQRLARRFAEERDRIRADVDARGVDPVASTYVAELGGRAVDASLLLLPLSGYEAADTPRMRATVERVRAELDAGGGLLHRNRESAGRGEGAFGICSFWAAEALALGAGALDEAVAAFDAVAARVNDVGLLPEEIDAGTGAFLGNFPQAFTHVGLINAAMALEERGRRELGGPLPAAAGWREWAPEPGP